MHINLIYVDWEFSSAFQGKFLEQINLLPPFQNKNKYTQWLKLYAFSFGLIGAEKF